MAVNDLWKYCSQEQEKEMLLSLHLLEGTNVREEKHLACLYAVSNHTKEHYHPVNIKKKGGGTRKLLVPDALLRQIQKNILHHVLDGLSVSEYATAYKKKASIKDNAIPHIGKEQILKLDISNFFENITFPLVYQYAFPAVYFPGAVRTMLTSLCCYEDYLPQGAPASPAISNLVMKPFDEYMAGWCRERGICYTRYCDDMTFSGVCVSMEVKNKAESFLRTMGFELNRKKTKILKKYQRQMVTGIVVNETARVSREYCRALRREIYYCRKYGAGEHLNRIGAGRWETDGKPDVARYLNHLLGRVNYILQVNEEDDYFQKARDEIKRQISEKSVIINETR